MNALVKNTSMTACILAGALSAVVASAANAEVLQLNYRFASSGWLNGRRWDFGGQTTITAIVDTGDRVAWSRFDETGYQLPHLRTYFRVEGVFAEVLSGEITTALSTVSKTTDFMGPSSFQVGFGFPSTPGAIPWNYFNNGSLAPWNMQGPLSEIILPYSFGDLVKPVLSTTVGNLQFGDGNGSIGATYFSVTPVAVPAPGAFALVGLAGAFSGRRRRN